MQAWKIAPFVGVGPLTFLMKRADVRSVLGCEYTTFMKATTSESLTDAYDTIGVYVHYDASDCVKYVEMFSPCIPVIMDIELMPGQLDDIVNALKKSGVPFQKDDAGGIGYEHGLSIYAPMDQIECIGAFRKGY